MITTLDVRTLGRNLQREGLPGGWTITWYQANTQRCVLTILEKDGKERRPTTAPRYVRDRLLTLENAVTAFLAGDCGWPKAGELADPEMCG